MVTRARIASRARWGEVPVFDFAPKPHWELGEALGILDLASGAKVTGSGFPILRGMGAKLVRALANFMLDLHTTEHGYEEVAPPYLVNRASMQGTGQLPKFGDELYSVPADGLFLIPTSEVPLTNIYRDTILDGSALPAAVCAWTPCFRREAGAAGKDTRGLIRIHQFDKVELVRLCRPEDTEAQHEVIARQAETVLERLGLPYRRLALAAGDTGFPARAPRTWRCGLPVSGHGSRCRAPAPSPISRPVVPASAFARPPGPSPNSCTPSTHRASRSRGRLSPCWRTTRQRTVR